MIQTMGENLINFNDINAEQFEQKEEKNTNNFTIENDEIPPVNPLQAVFNSCDYNGDGYVKISDLLNLAKTYSTENNNGEEELQVLLEQLDENGEGKITFDAFAEKIQEFMQAPRKGSITEVVFDERETILSPITSHVSVADQENGFTTTRARSFTDSEGFFEEGDSTSHSTASTNDYNGDLEEPVFSTPLKDAPKKKTKHDIYSTFPPNGKHGKKSRTPLFELRHRQLSRTSEYQSQEDEVGFESNEEESFHSLPLSYTPSSSRLAVMHIGVSQSARNSLHSSREEMGIMANHKHSHSDSETDYSFLNEEIQKLSAQLSLMKMDQHDHNSKQYKIQEDNKVLVNRINALEEQLHDQKLSAQQTVEEHNSKYKKQLEKVQFEHDNHLHNLQLKLGEAEGEINNLKTVEPMLRKEIESSLEERRLAQQKVESLQSELVDKEKELEQLKYKLRSKTDELERERISRGEEILMLTQEIENLKYMKNAAINQFDERNDLIKQIEILKKDNNHLKESKDDLCNQLLQKSTLMELDKKSSLADELMGADKNDVLDALREEELENHRLKQYIDQLLILIMTSDPMLLEK